MADFRINITSEPSNARIFIDDIYIHHLTPSDEREMKDVLELIQPGPHLVRVEKAGAFSERIVDVIDGDNGIAHFVLESPGLPGEEPPETEPDTVQFSITSNPSGGKVWIDEVYTHHLTPTDEKEQKDVLELWTEGTHHVRVNKGGYAAEKDITLVKGQRVIENFDLGGGEVPGGNCASYITQIAALQDQVNSLNSQITDLQSQLSTCQAALAECEEAPPEEPGEQGEKIIQSWAVGDIGEDDEQGAIGSWLDVDLNDDGSYTKHEFYDVFLSSVKLGVLIGNTKEGWEVWYYVNKLRIFTGGIRNDYPVYYSYIPRL